ncbi:hypothetical protein LJK88_30505 [Paenibacillus sp. P26]|nr:hypothetical protein LJK88_30505 [Paenibacillus sp. P26]
MLTLKGRRVHKTVEPETGWSILDTALKHEIDWGFSCMRGTCSLAAVALFRKAWSC